MTSFGFLKKIDNVHGLINVEAYVWGGFVMKDLFCMDFKDYNPNGKVFARPSVRAIIEKDGKVLLVYSKKYHYYKLPGGGIEKGESNESALVREVLEETGYQIIMDSIEAYGKILRRQKDAYDENCIFEQENCYYFCEIKDEKLETNLDSYEKEEGFTAVWVEPMVASRYNMREFHSESVDQVMVQREAKVLDMIDLEIRNRTRLKKEKNAIKMLGNLDYAGMLDFVKETLKDDVEYTQSGKSNIAYNRYEHTLRVLNWAKKLYDLSICKEQLNYEDLMIATIFHDVGRKIAIKSGVPHAKAGIPIVREYLEKNDFERQRIEYICELVGSHSDKERMQEESIDKNLLLLMEADLLDDTGALGVVMDCMITEARRPEAKFTDCLDHIMRFTRRIQMENPMITEGARKIWDEKRRIVYEFTDSLRKDIEME